MQIGTRRLRTPNLSMPHLPKPRTKAGKVFRALLPLVFIALGVYVFYNFPALYDRTRFLISKPKAGNSGLLPATVRAQNPTVPIGSSAQCGKPIPYDGAGNPTLICDNYIYIPRIRVAAPIVRPASTDDGTINAELLKGVLKYPGTAEPGEKGNVFLTGHSSYYWWKQSDYKTVFSLVPELVGGDEIIVYSKGVRYIYKVSEIRTVGPTAVDVMRPTPDPVVTLSTCVPVGTSYQRRIVRAKQTTPDPSTARTASSDTTQVRRLPGVR